MNRGIEALFGSFALRPTVRVLFYTDDAGMVNLNADVHSHTNEFGVRILYDLIVADQSQRPTILVDLVDRHEGGHAARKLLPPLLAHYDELWLFGLRQANIDSELENELTDPEVQALEVWMGAGGVLITGDHANPKPRTVLEPGLDRLLGLGRAIAHRVPRAGLLRSWEGNPSIIENEYAGTFSFNTQVPLGNVLYPDISSLDLQQDDRPQVLLLKTFPGPSGNPFFALNRVHPIFCGTTSPVTVFPDHMHEGQLTIPASFPAEIWPMSPNGQPQPEVIARGTDQRNGAIYDIVSAYDGSAANAGRIVADSTWHHYFNVNLKGFLGSSSILPRLAEYYRNLTEWLAPPAKRAAIARWRLMAVSQNPSVVMATGNSLRVVGDVASNVLRRSLGACVVGETVTALLKEAPSAGLRELPPAFALGGIVDATVKALDGRRAEMPQLAQVVFEGVAAAYDEYISGLDGAAERARAERSTVR
jgi:hypothetical protein